MKNILLFAAFAGIFLLSSCKKDNNSPNSQNGTSMAKTYTEDIRSSVVGNSVTTYNLSYDANGRLTDMVSTPAPPLLEFVYTYATNNSFTLDLYENQALAIHQILWLNTSSLLDSSYQYNDTNDSTTDKYFYNSNKQLTQEKNYDYSVSGATLNKTTSYTYDIIGNLTAQNDDSGESIVYDYYTNMLNTYPMGQAFLPPSYNMVRSATLTSGGIAETTTHFYSFDNSNRLIKDSIITSSSDLIAIKSYTY